MRVRLAYGSTGLDVELPDEHVTVIQPTDLPGLDDERTAIRHGLTHPIESPPLADLVAPSGEIAIVFPDVTRPMPSIRVLPVLLDHLEELGVADDRVVLISATGTHRANTLVELEEMVGPRLLQRYEVINHDCRDDAALTLLGTLSDDVPIWINSRYVRAKTRILTGFIEPHFFAGFSGGSKGVCPGLAGLQTVLECHNLTRIGSPLAAFGILDGNPVQEMVLDAARLVPPSFSLDVTINSGGQTTAVFAGGLPQSHRVGCDFVRRTAMQPVDRRFDIVITTNSGYPLDQNLYQTVKGMAAAARIVCPGGSIVVASECRDGLPNGGHYARILEASTDPQDALGRLAPPGSTLPDQWEVQVQAIIQKQARCFLFTTGLDADQVRAALLEPVSSIEEAIAELLRERPDAQIAVLPQGPQTIPYLVN